MIFQKESTKKSAKETNKKAKKPSGKSSKQIPVEKDTIEEYFYMIPAEVTVSTLAEAMHSVSEEAKEIWTELDLMEVILNADSLVFENMLDTFEDPADQAFLAEKGVKAVYAVNYNTKDKSAVKEVLQELHSVFGGFLASDTEDLQPIIAIEAF